eukprot:gb/GECG01009181.1/.p1 GENE.gb/GECG01009181.1/~~gb/GECG01009181.1/.p1  ORF type:complete len:524 (+),score=65.52 gb/GECG01009181.1/:1-1572(+)
MSSSKRMQSIDRLFPSRKSPRARRNLFRTKNEPTEHASSGSKPEAPPSSPVPGTRWNTEAKSQKKIREEAIAEKRRNRESFRTDSGLQTADVNERFGEFETLASHLAPSPVSEGEGPTDRIKRKHEDAFQGKRDILESASNNEEEGFPHRPVARRYAVSSSATTCSSTHQYRDQPLPTGLQLPRSHERLLKVVDALDRAFSFRPGTRSANEISRSINIQVSDKNFEVDHLRQIMGVFPGLYNVFYRKNELMVQPTEEVKNGTIMKERRNRFHKALLHNVARKHIEFVRSRPHQAITGGAEAETLDELLPADGRWHPEFALEKVDFPDYQFAAEESYSYSSIATPRATPRPRESEDPSHSSSATTSPEASSQETHTYRHTDPGPSRTRRSLYSPWKQLASKTPSTKQRKAKQEFQKKSRLEVEKEELKGLLWYLTSGLSSNGKFVGQLISDVKREATRTALREKNDDTLLRMIGELESLGCITSTKLSTRQDKLIKLNTGGGGASFDMNGMLERIDNEYAARKK